MNDYMRALHQRFFREPNVSELEEDIENTRQEVRDCLDKMQRRRLMHLVDSQNLLKEEISLASFTAGFKLAWGLSKELEAVGDISITGIVGGCGNYDPVMLQSVRLSMVMQMADCICESIFLVERLWEKSLVY